MNTYNIHPYLCTIKYGMQLVCLVKAKYTRAANLFLRVGHVLWVAVTTAISWKFVGANANVDQ